MSAQATRMSDGIDFNVLPIIVAVVIVIFTYVLLRQFFGRVKGNNIVFVGIEGSGKTALYAQLVAGKEVQTHTSLQENKTQLANSTLSVVDVPGNARLRNEMFARHAKAVRGVVVVIDSADFVEKVRDCTEVLYEVLLNNDVQKSKCPVLIFCNKQDEEMARGAKAICTAMERELTTLNNTACSTLSDDSGSQRTLAPANQTIKLEKMVTMVTSEPGISAGPDVDISKLEAWIAAL